MTTEQKADLAQAQERFARLDGAEQERLRELASRVQADADHEELSRVMARYYAWVKDLPAYTRAELLEGSPEERIARIKHLLDEQARSRGRRLGPQDVAVLRRWIETYRDRYVKSLDPSEQKRLAELKPAERDRETSGQVFRRWIAAGGAASPEAEKALADLRSQLSPEARGLLQSEPPERQWRVVAGWIWRHSGMARLPRPRQPLNSEDLTRYFEQLNQPQQEYLLNLPGEQMKAVLEEMYRVRQSPHPRGFRRGGGRGPMRPEMFGPGPGPPPPDHLPPPARPRPDEPPPRDPTI